METEGHPHSLQSCRLNLFSKILPILLDPHSSGFQRQTASRAFLQSSEFNGSLLILKISYFFTLNLHQVLFVDVFCIDLFRLPPNRNQ